MVRSSPTLAATMRRAAHMPTSSEIWAFHPIDGSVVSNSMR
jgi:hypothetical protein